MNECLGKIASKYEYKCSAQCLETKKCVILSLLDNGYCKRKRRPKVKC